MVKNVEVLWVARYDYPPGWRMNIPHEHDYYQIISIIDGTGELALDGVKVPACPGKLFFMQPYREHQLYVGPENPLKTYDMKFLVHDPDLALEMARLEPEYSLSCQDQPALIKRIREEGKSRKLYYKDFCNLLLAELLLNLIRIGKDGQERVASTELNLPAEESGDLCHKVVDFIQKHYREELTLSMIAANVGYNQSYICQIFKQHLQSTPIRYVYLHRIAKAKELIAFSDYSLKQIAELTGFKDVHHFTRVFHDIEGLTPGEWRKREKEGIRKGIFIDESFTNTNFIHPK